MKNEIYWLNKDSRKFLERGYLTEGETPEQRIKDIADKAEFLLGNLDGFSDKFVDYMSKGFYSLSSPIWSNFGRERGLPISCFGSFISDQMSSILEKISEHVNKVSDLVEEMITARKKANNISDTREKAIAYCDEVKGKYFDAIRYSVDKLELLVDDTSWYLPKYREILFLR